MGVPIKDWNTSDEAKRRAHTFLWWRRMQAALIYRAGVEEDFDDVPPTRLAKEDACAMIDGTTILADTIDSTRGHGETIPQMLDPNDPGLTGKPGRPKGIRNRRPIHRKRGRPPKLPETAGLTSLIF